MTHIEFMKHVRSEVHASLRDLETGGGGGVGGHTELQETKKLLNGVDGGEGGGGVGLEEGRGGPGHVTSGDVTSSCTNVGSNGSLCAEEGRRRSLSGTKNQFSKVSPGDVTSGDVTSSFTTVGGNGSPCAVELRGRTQVLKSTLFSDFLW